MIASASVADGEYDELKTAIDNTKEDGMQRANRIRIKQRYNCTEQEVVRMRAPFLGFSVLVRFQSRARIHNIKIINANAIEKLLNGNPVPYS